MWICLNNAFISIVEPKPHDIPNSERRGQNVADLLMVRARKREHLQAVFVNRRIHTWKNRDYPFRVFVNRQQLAKIVAAHVIGLDYDNFKNSVADDELHDAYSAVWGVMHRYQHGGFQRKRFDWSSLGEPDTCETCGWFKRSPDGDNGGLTVCECPDLSDIPETDAAWFASALLHYPPNDADEPCQNDACTPDHPCLDCMNRALAEPTDDELLDLAEQKHQAQIMDLDPEFAQMIMGEPDSYGPFDDQDDEGALSSQQVPPR